MKPIETPLEYYTKALTSRLWGCATRNVLKVARTNKVRVKQIPGCRAYFCVEDVHRVLSESEISIQVKPEAPKRVKE